MAGKQASCLASHFFIKSIVIALALLMCGSATISFAAGANTAANHDQRIQHLERLLKNQNLLEILTSLQNLQREVSQLRGDVELLSHNLGEVKQQQKEIYIDIDQRIEELDKRLSAGIAVVQPVVESQTQISDEKEQLALNEQEGYQAALANLKEGRYDEAIESFQVYLITYPSSNYAPNAQYWMAEAYYVLKNYQSAVAQFNKVINAYPSSRKVPDAYLKLGFSFYELKDWQNARQALQKIMSDHTGSTAANLAKRRLQKMEQEGKF